jgi:hypothetical protein
MVQHQSGRLQRWKQGTATGQQRPADEHPHEMYKCEICTGWQAF